MTYSREELCAAALLLADSADGTTPPELMLPSCACRALPVVDYVIYDHEGHPNTPQVPSAAVALGGTLLAQWLGSEPGALGYGDLTLLQTRVGPGLLFSFCGSAGQSACSVWLLPAELEGWLVAGE